MFSYCIISPSYHQTHILGPSWRQLCLLGTTMLQKWCPGHCRPPASLLRWSLLSWICLPNSCVLKWSFSEKSDPQALKHLHCFKRMEEMSASNYHIYSSFFCPGENRRSSFLKTCKYFTFVWRADFFPGVWKAEVTDTWLRGNAIAECKHRLFLAQQNLPIRPCWGQEGVSLM